MKAYFNTGFYLVNFESSKSKICPCLRQKMIVGIGLRRSLCQVLTFQQKKWGEGGPSFNTFYDERNNYITLAIIRGKLHVAMALS